MLNESLNQHYKNKQNQWQQNSRKNEARKLNAENFHADSVQSERQPKLKCKVLRQSTIRKRAERMHLHLPESGQEWATTLSHVIKNASSKRRSLLFENEKRALNKSSDLDQTLNINKIGRPSKEHEAIKRQLAFPNEAETFWNNKRSLKRYCKRQKAQLKHLSKSKKFREIWKDKIETFLSENSRVMPNNLDTVKISGKVVPKYHLLASKLQL